MERLSTHIKKFIIPYIIVLIGLSLLYTAFFSGTSNISQSGDFSFGAFSVLLLGVVIILILRNVIQKSFFKFIIPILIIYCIVLSYKTYNSITTTIAQIELKSKIDLNVKQGLRDIEVAQIEYKKKYGWYSNSFRELKRFLEEDSVYSVSTIGSVPDYKITPEHQEILGYDPIRDYIEIESYDEKEALICGLLSKDTSWQNVKDKLFPNVTDSSKNREFEFVLSNLNKVNLTADNSDSYFIMDSDILETSDETTYECLLYKNGTKHHFVSANIIDFNQNDTAYYNTDVDGLIVKDSIPQIPSLIIGDILKSVGNKKFKSPIEIYQLIKEVKKDTLDFEILRNNEIRVISLTQKDIMPKPSRINWSDLEDMLNYNLLPPYYNPDGFEKMFIDKNMVIKEDEFSSPSLDLKKFKLYLAKRKFDTTNLVFEFNRDTSFNYSSLETTDNTMYLFTKIGTPVFKAYDPSPYDPLVERDTLITGSLTEVKTSGNWK